MTGQVIEVTIADHCQSVIIQGAGRTLSSYNSCKSAKEKFEVEVEDNSTCISQNVFLKMYF